MKQVLGEKKLKKCQQITGVAYRVAYTRGSREHFLAECWYGDGETLYDFDWVNYKTGEWRPGVRDGQPVKA